MTMETVLESCTTMTGEKAKIEPEISLGWMETTAQALAHWGLEDAHVKALSLSENATYRVEPVDGSGPYVLRLHRPAYRSVNNVRSEMAWVKKIHEDGRIVTARVIPTLDGNDFCTYINPYGEMQIADLMEFLSGHEPLDESMLLSAERIGGVAARLHSIAKAWERPEWFERIEWNEARLLGENSDYGDWRDTPEVTFCMETILERAEEKALAELAEYGKTPENYGLVHTDLRSSNLLIGEDGTLKVLDFDDCGDGWYLFDVATSFTFEDTKPDIEDNIYAYLRGYRLADGPIPDEDFAFLPAMLMARRLNMVAWVEKRRETEWAQQIRGWFVEETVEMALSYLADSFLPHLLADVKAGTLTDAVMRERA